LFSYFFHNQFHFRYPLRFRKDFFNTGLPLWKDTTETSYNAPLAIVTKKREGIKNQSGILSLKTSETYGWCCIYPKFSPQLECFKNRLLEGLI